MGTIYDVKPLEGFQEETGILLAALKDGTREWRGELGEVPVEAITWQPWPESHSIGALLLHNIDVEAYWFEQFAAGMARDPEELKLVLSEETDVDAVKWPIPPNQPLSWYYDLHDRVRARAFQAIREIDPTRQYKGRESMLSLRSVVSHVLQHDSYHGGQAVLLNEMWKKVGQAARL